MPPFRHNNRVMYNKVRWHMIKNLSVCFIIYSVPVSGITHDCKEILSYNDKWSHWWLLLKKAPNDSRLKQGSCLLSLLPGVNTILCWAFLMTMAKTINNKPQVEINWNYPLRRNYSQSNILGLQNKVSVINVSQYSVKWGEKKLSIPN